jgi:hypothetical protein
MNIYIVIVTSFAPVFLQINEYRRQLCKKYNLPVLFVYNGKTPEGYQLKEDERVLPMEGPSPAMFLKFKMAIKEIYGMADPDYIVRINTRTFVDFKNLKYFLSYVGKEKAAAGAFMLNDNKVCLSGICMIFSRDVALRFAMEDNVQGPALWHSDDCCISWAVKDYANFHDMTYFYHDPNSLVFDELPTTLPAIHEKAILFRIRNGPANGSPMGSPLTLKEQVDIQCWKLLMKHCDGIDMD